jgi:hypothetical protein
MSDQPAPRLPSPDNPFEIGLVMAGAISAGAYTAGVMDFLIQALDEWEKAKAHALAHPDDPSSQDCPKHKVRLKVMAGASAGGMTAGLTTGLLGMAYQPVTTQLPPDRPSPPIVPVNNNLYRNWVNTIDIDPLLGVKDLEDHPEVPVQSILDSSILRTVAADAFLFEEPDKKVDRPYVSETLHVLLAVTNLRGVPYPVTFTNQEKVQQYVMTMHADNMHFVVGTHSPQGVPDAVWLKPYEFQDKDTWGRLEASALATGAFPFGLAPRLLDRPADNYQHRQFPISTPCKDDITCTFDQLKVVPPYWPQVDRAEADAAKLGKEFSYEFLCVDGGVMNNEPLDLARTILAGPEGVNPRDGDKATRALIMIMPFPNADPFPASYSGRTNFIELLYTMFDCLMTQARFKPEELTLADDPEVYSRFLIVPRRSDPITHHLEPYPIAGGSIEGFGGFLSRRFREHDYQLGRRNCQRFLKNHFVLPSEGEKRNRLFDHWTSQARARHTIASEPDTPRSTGASADRQFLPIIPLMGAAIPEVPQPAWPTYTQADFDQLRPKVKKRLTRVVGALIDQNIEGWIWGPVARAILKFFWWIKCNYARNSIMAIVMNYISNDLGTRKLMK